MKKAKSFFIILIFLPCLQIRAQSPQLGIDTIDKIAKNATDIQYFSVPITEEVEITKTVYRRLLPDQN